MVVLLRNVWHNKNFSLSRSLTHSCHISKLKKFSFLFCASSSSRISALFSINTFGSDIDDTNTEWVTQWNFHKRINFLAVGLGVFINLRKQIFPAFNDVNLIFNFVLKLKVLMSIPTSLSLLSIFFLHQLLIGMWESRECAKEAFFSLQRLKSIYSKEVKEKFRKLRETFLCEAS